MADKQVTYNLNLRGKFESQIGRAENRTRRFDKSMGQLIGRFAAFSAVSGVLVNSVKKIAELIIKSWGKGKIKITNNKFH